MHLLRDSASIRGAVTALPEVASFLMRRLDELAEYTDFELSDLVHVCVIQQADTLAQVDAALGFQVEHRTADVMESHGAWCELTYVLSDDGFGVVLYVPLRPDIDPGLLALCTPRTP